MRYPRSPLPVAVAVLLAALAGCAPATPAATAPDPGPSATLPGFVPSGMPGMSMGAPAPSGRQPAATPSDSSAPATVPANSVAIRDFAFAPATVTVPVGTTLTWTNRDQEPHTVTATGGAFRSPTLGTGDTFHFTFTRPGRYDYLCTIHPFMTATVVVTP